MTTETIALHYPFYPSKDNEDYVTYFIDKIQGEILHVKLSEMISDIDKVGNPMIIDLPEKYTLLTEWYNPIFPLSYKKSELYEKSKYITYVVEVIDKKGSYFHRISYATKPFPTSEEVLLNKRQPIPVYIVSNRDKAMNCVFIQDIDMSSISNVDTKKDEDKLKIIEDDVRHFYYQANSIIHNAIQKEPFLRKFRNSYNFYINPVNSDFRTLHTRYPKNHSNLSFAQLKMILHKIKTDNDKSEYGYSSSEYYDFGTFLHEAGHSYFELQDEYDDGGMHEQLPEKYPNNWKSRQGVEIAVNNYSISESNIQKKSTFWKICNDNCAMNNSELFVYPYGIACKYAILNVMLIRAKYKSVNLLNYKLNKDENKIVQKVNTYMEKFRFDIKYKMHIGFFIKWNAGNKKYDILEQTIRQGEIPYNKIENNKKNITYYNRNKNIISAFSLPLYLFYARDNMNVVDKSKEHELLMPDDNSIKQIEIKYGNELIKLDLDQNFYSQLK